MNSGLQKLYLGPRIRDISDTVFHRGVPRSLGVPGCLGIDHMDFMMNASGKYINDVHFNEGVFSTDESAARASRCY